MKHSNVAARLKTAIQRAPIGCVVYVAQQYAEYFTAPPSDEHTYVVEDPRRPHVLHCTNPDGTYMRIDDKNPLTVGAIPIVINPKRVFHRDRKNVKHIRFAHKVSTKVTAVLQEDTPTICLIDISRVMRITGFKKSFIYEQMDFPKPVRLGTSRRSSVRWVEAEIYQWVNTLLTKRSSHKVSI
jgi:predicted DNA-binding transcriptional regulator AlpA